MTRTPSERETENQRNPRENERNRAERQHTTNQYAGNEIVVRNRMRAELDFSDRPLATVPGLSVYPPQQQITVGIVQTPELVLRPEHGLDLRPFRPNTPISDSKFLSEFFDYRWNQNAPI